MTLDASAGVDSIGFAPRTSAYSTEPPYRDLYRAIDVVSFKMGGARELVYSPVSRKNLLLQSDRVRFLRGCHEFRTLDDHAKHIGEEVGSPTEPIREMLKTWVEAGLLVSADYLLHKLAEGRRSPEVSEKIATLGIPTRNRVPTLKRALVSYVENGRRYGRQTRFVISDDSEDEKIRNFNREMLRSLRRQYGIEIFYAGIEERLRFAEAAVRVSHLPSELVCFALFNAQNYPTSHGASRNALLLHAVGENIVQVDDDTLCRMAAVPGSANHLAFASEMDPTQFWFFPDNETALSSVEFVDQDFLAVHEQLLGMDIANCISRCWPAPACDFRAVSARFLRRLERGQGLVRVTSLGVIGDSGIGRSAYLFLAEDSLRRLTENETTYGAFLTSRQVLRAATRETISDWPFCMGAALGLANQALLPPFSPVQRYEEGVFAAILTACFQDGYFGFLPWAILHLPPEQRAVSPEDIFVDLIRPRTNDILVLLIDSFGPQAHQADDRQRLEALGRYLADIGSMPIADFEEFVRALLWRAMSRQLLSCEARLQRGRELPDYWARDFRKSIDLLSTVGVEESFAIPNDLTERYGADEARSRFKCLVLKLGKLLEVWPELVEAARNLRASGEWLAQPVA